MNRKLYLVIFLVFLMAAAATGVYLRQRAKASDAALRQAQGRRIARLRRRLRPPPPRRLPTLPGFAIEPACGTGADAPKPAAKVKAK